MIPLGEQHCVVPRPYTVSAVIGNAHSSDMRYLIGKPIHHHLRRPQGQRRRAYSLTICALQKKRREILASFVLAAECYGLVANDLLVFLGS